jgi:hypothetical protein
LPAVQPLERRQPAAVCNVEGQNPETLHAVSAA